MYYLTHSIILRNLIMNIRKTFPLSNIYIYYFPHNVNFGNGSFVSIIEAAKMTPMGIEATNYLITQTAWREKVYLLH